MLITNNVFVALHFSGAEVRLQGGGHHQHVRPEQHVRRVQEGQEVRRANQRAARDRRIRLQGGRKEERQIKDSECLLEGTKDNRVVNLKNEQFCQAQISREAMYRHQVSCDVVFLRAWSSEHAKCNA